VLRVKENASVCRRRRVEFFFGFWREVSLKNDVIYPGRVMERGDLPGLAARKRRKASLVMDNLNFNSILKLTV